MRKAKIGGIWIGGGELKSFVISFFPFFPQCFLVCRYFLWAIFSYILLSSGVTVIHFDLADVYISRCVYRGARSTVYDILGFGGLDRTL
ncbi:hypothetical protein BDY21DRAFT_333196 [Lineolata rhizophorae]|uniref:Uncharacterized protein n=1 Tax=Lineolata rhizophorae TaxID=578093 RepID=A0A6A6P9R4_9PEZI|nr:hypothetical protein BDY21DRAFT_333196 [Lineolata rhizophorae]